MPSPEMRLPSHSGRPSPARLGFKRVARFALHLVALNLPLALLLFATATMLRASDFQPLYLVESVPDIPAGLSTYEIWYTNNCQDGALAPLGCLCESGNPDNDCVASVALADGDNVPDTGPDQDGDGLLDIVDPDYTVRWTGTGVISESIPVMIQDVVNTYLGWGFRNPAFADIANRPIYLYNMPQFEGLAHGDGSHVDLDARRMKEPPPAPREAVIHEFWHMTQHAYGNMGDAGNWFIEGQARSMQDKVFSAIDDSTLSGYFASAQKLLADPNFDREQDITGDFDPDVRFPGGLKFASYDAALFWTYLIEQAGDEFAATPGEGVDFMKDVFAQMILAPLGGEFATEVALTGATGQGFDRTYLDFVVANYARKKDLRLLDPAAIGGRNPQEVFTYRDEAGFGTTYRTVTRTVISTLPTGAAGTVDPVELGFSANGLSLTVDASGQMPPYGAEYFEAPLPSRSTCPVVKWRAEAQRPGALLHHTWMLMQADTNGVDGEEIVGFQEYTGDVFEVSAINSDANPDYTTVAAIVATTNQLEGFDWELSCAVPIVQIVVPVGDEPAAVGAPDAPGSFEVWLDVRSDDGTPIAGLEARRDFRVRVGGDQAQVLSGEYVQDQYWLVVKAPDKTGQPLGSLFDLEVELAGLGASDEVPNGILYDTLPTDKVLIIDRSGSMSANNRLASAKAAARIESSASNAGDWLGVVSFHDTAANDFPMTFVPDQNDAANVRADARAAIDAITLGNQTSIGGGLRVATDLLNGLGTAQPDTLDDRWLMVLLSDGEQNRAPFWEDVANDVIATGADVHAIAFGDQADDNLMHDIARLTCSERRVDLCYWELTDAALPFISQSVPGGPGPSLASVPPAMPGAGWRLRPFVGVATSPPAPLLRGEGRAGSLFPVREGGHLAALEVRFPSAQPPPPGVLTNPLADIYMRIDEAATGRQRLWQEAGTGNGSFIIQVGETGQDGVFSVNWRDPGRPVNVTLNGPAPASFIQRTDGANHSVFYTADLPAGAYTVQLSGAGADWVASLSARVVQGTDLRVAFANTLADRAVGEPARLRASLVNAAGPVQGATVVATVTRPDGATETVTLSDDGAGADTAAGDGIYSLDYERINEIEEHNYTFDIEASGDGFERYLRATYRPVDTTYRDANGDDLLDRWQRPYRVIGGTRDPDRDGLTNAEEMELGTNPVRSDSDFGGEADGSEVDGGRDPLDAADDAIPALRDVWAENGNGRVVLHFSRHPRYQRVAVLRRSVDDPNGTVRVYPAASGVITDTGLVNGTSYLYILQPMARNNTVRGAYSNVVLGQAKADPVPPEGFFSINGGMPETADLDVTLGFYASTNPDGSQDIVQMKVSNEPYLADDKWVPFTTSLPWTLRPDPESGLAIVYAVFLDAAGNVSPYVASDAIQYTGPLPP